MKVLVAYMSKTGNTKKVAEAIFDEIKYEKEIKSIDEVNDIEGYDLAFLGFPIHGFGPDKKAKKFLEEHCTDKKRVALFITHASPEDHEELPAFLTKFEQAAAGANLLGMFDCQGELAKGVKFVMSIHPEKKLRTWSKEDNSKGQPNATRLEKARLFSREVIEKFRNVVGTSELAR